MSTLGALARLDAVAQADLVARGEVRRDELLDAFCERYEAVNPLVRAVPIVDVDRAREAEVRPGPFAGVPFLVKDALPWPGLRWSMGSRLFARNVASGSTPLGERIDFSNDYRPWETGQPLVYADYSLFVAEVASNFNQSMVRDYLFSTHEDRDFQVAGHTDNEPIRRSRFTSNWELSTVRALEVVQYLQEQGVTPTHLSAAGYSEFAPVAQNDSEDGRTENRRIEIVLMPNYDELPDLSGLEGTSCGEAAQ